MSYDPSAHVSIGSLAHRMPGRVQKRSDDSLKGEKRWRLKNARPTSYENDVKEPDSRTCVLSAGKNLRSSTGCWLPERPLKKTITLIAGARCLRNTDCEGRKTHVPVHRASFELQRSAVLHRHVAARRRKVVTHGIFQTRTVSDRG